MGEIAGFHFQNEPVYGGDFPPYKVLNSGQNLLNKEFSEFCGALVNIL